ncbi:Putative tyrosinase-like protein tyr-3 [Toxocara canis]|uniref:Putative tyrosinase-like protein tyr-3 n=1 Tax=Toxocara canis TaxID=6265 RepID=A0A0B2VHS7_TOXCA|nr:Putative tyrosinase-like protein tyr-3 [Toxocara canis]
MRKSIRKEYRMLSEWERDQVHRAMNALKNRWIDNITAWDLHTLVHYPDSAPGAHWGPAFLPWHREYLRQFEVAMQKEVPGVSLPYWDSTLDHGLPDPSDSVMWMDSMLGNGNGYVKTGAFANWNTNTFMPMSPVPVHSLYRSTGGQMQDRLLSVRDVEWIDSRLNFSDLTFCHDKTFESMHGLSHVWVGGFMYVIRVSPNDPAFYMHHAFVDYLWERFRMKRQTRRQRENDYATNICDAKHALDAPMRPFNMTNKDGLSNEYTDVWYEYEPVRHCFELDPQCQSEFYFCDKNLWRCRSKIQAGGNCTGFSGTDICYKSYCIDDVCRLPPSQKEQRRKQTDITEQLNVVFIKTLLIGDHGEPIVDPDAFVEVKNTEGTVTGRSFVQENVHFPEIPGLIYVAIPKPRDFFPQQVQLHARDQYGRYCQSHCYNATSDRYEICQPYITLRTILDGSMNLSYSHSVASRRYLDVDLSAHPSQLRVHMPNVVFACTRKMLKSDAIKEMSEELRPPASQDNYVWLRVSVYTRLGPGHIDRQRLQVEVFDEEDKPVVWRQSITRLQPSFDPNIVFIRVRNPAIYKEGVSVRVTLLIDNMPANCDKRCYVDEGVQRDCEGTIFLHNDASRSDEHVFSADESALELLGWKMVGHPVLWTHRSAFLNFYC